MRLLAIILLFTSIVSCSSTQNVYDLKKYIGQNINKAVADFGEQNEIMSDGEEGMIFTWVYYSKISYLAKEWPCRVSLYVNSTGKVYDWSQSGHCDGDAVYEY